MTMTKKYLFMLGAGLMILFTLPPVSKAGDCYSDCMDVANCLGPAGDRDSAYCGDHEATCTVRCLQEDEKRGKSYGAIAYSTKNGAYGFSDGWKDQKEAEQNAVKFCKQNGKGCKAVVWFYNSCAAVVSDGKKVEWGRAASAQAAIQEALEKCNKGFFKKHCGVKASHCSW